MILDGTIIEKSPLGESTKFDIQINEIFKGATNSKLITGFIEKDKDWILDEGDTALIYLGDKHVISIYSVKNPGFCTTRSLIQISPVLPNDNSFVRGAPVVPWEWKDPCVPYYFSYDPDFWNARPYYPPVKQFTDHRLPIHMQKCGSDEHVSIIPKTHSYHIACVKPQTASKLIERGWAECLWNCSGPIPDSLIDLDSVTESDCPISFMNQTGNEPIMRPPPMEVQFLGKAMNTIEEAKSYSGINDGFPPNYIPHCLELKQIYARNGSDGNKEITLLYMLNQTELSSAKYIDEVLQRGLAISFVYEKENSFADWIQYVNNFAAGNPSKRFDVGDKIFLVTNRNSFQLSATHATTITDNVRITLTSYIMDSDEIKKIASSMFEK